MPSTWKSTSPVQRAADAGTEPLSMLPLTRKSVRSTHAPTSAAMVPVRFELVSQLEDGRGEGGGARGDQQAGACGGGEGCVRVGRRYAEQR